MSPTDKPEPKSLEMDFPQALRSVIDGKSITKLEWDNPNIIVAMHKDHLSIRLSEKWHDLIVSDGDLSGTDWVVTDGENPSQ